MSRFGEGKYGTAPCGHRGVYIVGQFIQCVENCEVAADDFPEIEFCPLCKKSDIDLDFEVDPTYYIWNPGAARLNRRCWTCGSCWTKV